LQLSVIQTRAKTSKPDLQISKDSLIYLYTI